jgi:hypothetical protein
VRSKSFDAYLPLLREWARLTAIFSNRFRERAVGILHLLLHAAYDLVNFEVLTILSGGQLDYSPGEVRDAKLV